MMSLIPVIAFLLAEFVPACPTREITIGDDGVHDGIWDALRTPNGSFLCCGYSDGRVWIGSLSRDMQLEWELLSVSGSTNDEAVAICPYLDNYAVAVNSGVLSPGARHQLQDAAGWILCIDEDGNTLDTLSCSTGSRRIISCITPGPCGRLACCGIIYSSDPHGSGAFWLIDRSGSIANAADFGPDSITSIDCIQPLPGGGYILGGSSSVSQSFTVMRVDSAGDPQWIARAGSELGRIHARDIHLTGEGSCIAVGGGLWNDPLAVELDLDSGELVRTIIDDGWFTLFDCDAGTGSLLFIGHNMLCDGADSETMIIGVNSEDTSLPLSITCNGACRCRTLLSSGDELFIFGEVSEFWDGHQNIWAATTVRSDWITTETGSRLNAFHD